MKQFDHKFKEQVDKAFGNYNADHLADVGWNAFVEKNRSSSNLIFILPLWAKAASIVALLTVGGYLTFNSLRISNEPNLTNTDLSHTAIQQANERVKEDIVIQNDSAVYEEATIMRKIMVSNIKSYISKDENSEIIIINNEVTLNNAEQIALTETVGLEANESSFANATLSNAEINEDLEQIDNREVAKPLHNTLPLPYNLTFVDEQQMTPKPRKTSFLAGLSGMVARVDNLVSDAPGVSIGLYADRKLTESISVRPGLAIARHNYELQSLSNSELAFDFTAPNLDGFDGSVVSAENHMEIVAMEIPINFIFTISERKKSSLFISAGTSSMIYLNQRFTGTINSRYVKQHFDTATGNTYYETTFLSTESESEYSAFSKVDLFGFANLSAGYVFPFGKNSNIQVEPFIQLPISSITSNNLRIR
jgi:hypothetical protein